MFYSVQLKRPEREVKVGLFTHTEKPLYATWTVDAKSQDDAVDEVMGMSQNGGWKLMEVRFLDTKPTLVNFGEDSLFWL